jgi:hypothetical protein
MKIEQKQKDLIGKVFGIAGLVVVAIPITMYAAGAIMYPTSNLEALEANYKNAIKSHDVSVTQEILSAKNECFARSTLATGKLTAIGEGKLVVTPEKKAELGDLAGRTCYELTDTGKPPLF